jgi:hypothetical protein
VALDADFVISDDLRILQVTPTDRTRRSSSALASATPPWLTDRLPWSCRTSTLRVPI